MNKAYTRHIELEKIINFRDIGGYAARDGRTVAWRRVFRSASLTRMSPGDSARLSQELGLNFILDLRSDLETEKGICPLSQAGVGYHNVPLMTDGGDIEEENRLFGRMNNMGQFYLYLLGTPGFGPKTVSALEFIAVPGNHPLVFHCSAGKDRTGILAALLLSVLGVAEKDIVEDYTLSGQCIEKMVASFKKDPDMDKLTGHLPDYFWKSTAESMEFFLATLRRDYGSVTDYLYAQGMQPALVDDLKNALLA